MVQKEFITFWKSKRKHIYDVLCILGRKRVKAWKLQISEVITKPSVPLEEIPLILQRWKLSTPSWALQGNLCQTPNSRGETRLKAGSAAAQPVRKRDNSEVPNPPAVRSEKEMCWKTWSERTPQWQNRAVTPKPSVKTWQVFLDLVSWCDTTPACPPSKPRKYYYQIHTKSEWITENFD